MDADEGNHNKQLREPAIFARIHPLIQMRRRIPILRWDKEVDPQMTPMSAEYEKRGRARLQLGRVLESGMSILLVSGKSPCASVYHGGARSGDPAYNTACRAARYEYGPFGEMIRMTGPMAKLNPFRFSTKYHDDETDLLYYGHRYYSPSMGRWLSRDPIEERGGRNLYGFVGNNSVCAFDILGKISNEDDLDRYVPP